MPRERRAQRKRWKGELANLLAEVRARTGLASDDAVPDVVLLAEAEAHFEPADLWAPREWFNERLAGNASTEARRNDLRDRLLAEAKHRQEREAAITTWRSGRIRHTDTAPYRK